MMRNSMPRNYINRKDGYTLVEKIKLRKAEQIFKLTFSGMNQAEEIKKKGRNKISWNRSIKNKENLKK